MTLSIYLTLLLFFPLLSDVLSQQISLAQAVANNTQQNTYSFNGMAFISGSACCDSFLPPGKVADFFGFQAMRDSAPNGHSNLFLDNIASNMLTTLNSTQIAKMAALATDQTQINSTNLYAMQRFPLMVAFRRTLTGNLPSGSSGLSLTAVQNHSAYLYEIDANLTISRARLYAEIISSLNDTQKGIMQNMVSGGFYTWKNLSEIKIDNVKGDSQVLLTSYVGDIFAWFGGNIENYTYFCPERQGDYFGAFYVKDAPALLSHNYLIPSNTTGDGGMNFLNILSPAQKQIMMDIGNQQYTALMDLVEHRREISTELMKLLSGGTINETLIRVLDREYGMLDGKISYLYATAFSKVYKTLNESQIAQTTVIRNLNGFPCPDGYGFVYANNGTYPTVQNTDFLFEFNSSSSNSSTSSSSFQSNCSSIYMSSVNVWIEIMMIVGIYILI